MEKDNGLIAASPLALSRSDRGGASTSSILHSIAAVPPAGRDLYVRLRHPALLRSGRGVSSPSAPAASFSFSSSSASYSASFTRGQTSFSCKLLSPWQPHRKGGHYLGGCRLTDDESGPLPLPSALHQRTSGFLAVCYRCRTAAWVCRGRGWELCVCVWEVISFRPPYAEVSEILTGLGSLGRGLC